MKIVWQSALSILRNERDLMRRRSRGSSKSLAIQCECSVLTRRIRSIEQTLNLLENLTSKQTEKPRDKMAGRNTLGPIA